MQKWLLLTVSVMLLAWNSVVAFKTSISGKQYTFNQMKAVCISESNMVTFFRYNGQVHNDVSEISSAFCVRKTVKIRPL